MRSLTLRLILAFLLISIIGVGLAAVLARALTAREFDRFVMEQQRSEFIANAAAYYQKNGSWTGVDAYLRQPGGPPGPGTAQPPPPAPDGQQRPLPFLLVDQAGTVIIAAQPWHPGDRIAAGDLARGKPVDVAGHTVGAVLDAGRPPALDDRQSQYVASTNMALALAALGAVAIALLLGVVLARNLTRPLRDLTQAAQAMSRGKLKQEVPVRSADELGTLTQAFNEMSADLARANEVRRQMTADIAHDLRTPLTVITGYVEALRDGVLKPTPARFDAIYKEAQHLQRLVEDLRTLSLADAGELPMQRAAVSCRALIERLADAYAPQAATHDVALQISAEPEGLEVVVDPDRMIQVLGNLVSNALRYTPSGGRILLSACQQGSAVALVVQDNGTGIAPDVLPHIFDRFYRGDAARSQQEGESGLGLAIARSIVEAHGGTITATSALGQGTIFTIMLPVITTAR